MMQQKIRRIAVLVCDEAHVLSVYLHLAVGVRFIGLVVVYNNDAAGVYWKQAFFIQDG